MQSWVSVFLKRNLDLKVRTSTGFHTRVLERPGLWLAEDELDRLVAEMRGIARKAVPLGDLDYGVLSGQRDILKRAIITIVYRNADGMPVAFNALRVIELSDSGKPVDVLHLGLAMIDPEVHNQGLSWILYGLTCFLFFVRNQLRPLWISSVTQVPSVAGMVAETFSRVFPAPGNDARRSLQHQLIAREIMAKHRHVFGVGEEANFDIDRFVIENAFTGGSENLKKTFDQAPKHRLSKYNDFCESELDYVRGDDFLQIGQIDMNTARRYMSQNLPRNELVHLLLAGFVAALQRLALPTLYWFDSRRQWETLRPTR